MLSCPKLIYQKIVFIKSEFYFIMKYEHKINILRHKINILRHKINYMSIIKCPLSMSHVNTQHPPRLLALQLIQLLGGYSKTW